MNGTTPTTQDTPDKGRLQINLVSDISAYPIQGAQISIFYTGIPEAQLEQLTTDSSGQTDTIDLAAPPLEYSLNPENEVQPYSEYTMQITAEGFESVSIAGAEILADVTAIQNVSMKPIDTPEDEETVFVIPAHTLYATYPPKIPEDEIQPTFESGEIVLSRVVVPEYIVVHDGSPRDSTAKNYYVKYKDYIKNVASSEIFYSEPGIYRILPEPRIWFYDHFFNRIWSQMDSGTEYLWYDLCDSGWIVCRLSFQTECQAADTDAVLWRTAGTMSELDDLFAITYKVDFYLFICYILAKII